MTNPYDNNNPNHGAEEEEEEASPSMSRSAEDNLSNSDGPLLLATKRKPPSRISSPAMLLHQDNWHKSYSSGDDKRGNRFLWTLTLILTFVGFCNLLLNLTILLVLRVSQGMEAIELLPDHDLAKFYGNTDLDRVCLQRGVCEGFGDEPVELVGDAGGVHIKVLKRDNSSNGSNLLVLENGTSLSRLESFEIKDPRSGSPIFSTDSPDFSLPQGIKRIEVEAAQTHRIAAPKRSELTVSSDESVSLHGAEGMSFDSKDTILSARNGVLLKSRNADIVIDVNDSINMPKIPIAPAQSSNLRDQYKVCVCMPDGKIFLVPTNKASVKINCAKISRSMETDPCAS